MKDYHIIYPQITAKKVESYLDSKIDEVKKQTQVLQNKAEELKQKEERAASLKRGSLIGAGILALATLLSVAMCFGNFVEHSELRPVLITICLSVLGVSASCALFGLVAYIIEQKTFKARIPLVEEICERLPRYEGETVDQVHYYSLKNYHYLDARILGKQDAYDEFFAHCDVKDKIRELKTIEAIRKINPENLKFVGFADKNTKAVFAEVVKGFEVAEYSVPLPESLRSILDNSSDDTLELDLTNYDKYFDKVV